MTEETMPPAELTRVERFEQRTEWPMAVLAVLFLIAYAWPVLDPDLNPSWKRACLLTNYVIWVLFAAEFIWRVVLATRRGRYLWRNIADVLMIALPVLRPLRVLRLLVLLQMLNRRATSTLRGRVVVYICGSAALVLFSASLAMLDAERGKPGATIETFGDALWWAAATMTTVGYGDYTPVTTQGRAVGFALCSPGSRCSASSPPPWQPGSSTGSAKSTPPPRTPPAATSKPSTQNSPHSAMPCRARPIP
jgi:voltage-gated potassium channel